MDLGLGCTRSDGFADAAGNVAAGEQFLVVGLDGDDRPALQQKVVQLLHAGVHLRTKIRILGGRISWHVWSLISLGCRNRISSSNSCL